MGVASRAKRLHASIAPRGAGITSGIIGVSEHWGINRGILKLPCCSKWAASSNSDLDSPTEESELEKDERSSPL